MRHVSVLVLALHAVASTAAAQTVPVAASVHAATAEGPQARILALRGQVTVYAPRNHAAAVGETLTRGTRIRTGVGGGADIALENGTVLELGERANVVMFTSNVATPGMPPSTTTTILRGTVRTRVEGDNPRAELVPIAAGPITVYVGRTVVALSADAAGAVARLAVYRGRARVHTLDREYLVAAGHRVIERVDAPLPAVALPLLRPPEWTTAPPEQSLSVGDPIDVSGAWTVPPAPPTPGYLGAPPAPTQVRVQFARDENFRDLLSDTRVPASSTRWTGRSLAPGVYFVRMSTVDNERFEGPFSQPVRFRIAAPNIVPGVESVNGQPGQIARVEIPRGFYCNLDGGPYSTPAEPLRLQPGRSHRLRCVNASNYADARERTIPAQEAGPLHWDVRLNARNADGTLRAGLGELVVRLRNAEEHPVPWLSFRVTATNGVTVEPLRDDDERGSYIATVRWPENTRSTRVHIVASDSLTYDLDADLQ